MMSYVSSVQEASGEATKATFSIFRYFQRYMKKGLYLQITFQLSFRVPMERATPRCCLHRVLMPSRKLIRPLLDLGTGNSRIRIVLTMPCFQDLGWYMMVNLRLKSKITCRQISPFLPHNYKESSFPVAVFTFTVHNSGSTPADITLLFTWANSVGGQSELTGNRTNSKMIERDGVHGVLLHHRTADGHPSVTFAMTSQETEDVRVTDCPFFMMGSSNSGEFTAKNMWEEIKKHGSFGKASTDKEPRVSKPGSSIRAAVARLQRWQQGEPVWCPLHCRGRCPEVKFPDGKMYHRRYTKFYGFDQDEAAENLAHDAFLGKICSLIDTGKEHMDWDR